MNIEKLRYVLEIERCGTINKAAHNLFVSQPHLSKSLKALEESLGITIFRRTKQGVLITDEGKEFLQYARTIVSQMDLVTEKYTNRQTGGLSLKVSCMRSSHFMEGFVRFVEEYPKYEPLRITWKETGLFEVLEDVRSETAGLGFLLGSLREHVLFQNTIKSNQLEYTRLSRFQAYIILSEKNGLPQEEPVDLGSLQNYTYVAYGEFENILPGVDAGHRMTGLEPPARILTVHDRSTLLELLARKEYYTISHRMSEPVAQRYGLLSLAPKKPLYDAESGYVTHPLRILSSEEQRLIETMKSLYGE